MHICIIELYKDHFNLKAFEATASLIIKFKGNFCDVSWELTPKNSSHSIIKIRCCTKKV